MFHPIAPLGMLLSNTTLYVVWQGGGGVNIRGGTITLDSCDIHNNQVEVRICPHEPPHRPIEVTPLIISRLNDITHA